MSYLLAVLSAFFTVTCVASLKKYGYFFLGDAFMASLFLCCALLVGWYDEKQQR